MRILLIGEYSGVHNNLKAALISLGHDVVLMGDGDGYKSFGFDFSIAPHYGSLFSKFKNIFYIFSKIPSIYRFDIIQIINPYIIPLHYFYTGIFYLLLLRARKIIYYACGTDPNFLASKKWFSYFPFDDRFSTNYRHYNKWHLFYFFFFLRRVDLIISSCYTYRKGYLYHDKHVCTIPLPSSMVYPEVKRTRNSARIKILFGITRRDFKGASYIEMALERIRLNYPLLVEVRILEMVPFFVFEKALDSTDILIDQCRSYDYGMSAIFALERGVITMSGAEPIAILECFSSDCPVININPNVEQIYVALEELCLMSYDERHKLKCRSQDWVKRFHDSQYIAQKFLQIYQ
jgi:hypothetical protein